MGLGNIAMAFAAFCFPFWFVGWSFVFCVFFFFFNDTATTEIYTISLHDALPISCHDAPGQPVPRRAQGRSQSDDPFRDRKSTRLNSSHDQISYAVFCLKKKKRQMACTSVLVGLVNCSMIDISASHRCGCLAPPC